MAELNYPLGEHNRADVRSQTGKAADELTVADIRAGTITSADAAVDPDTLRRQAEFAEQGGNPQLADNLRRGAELALFSDDDVLRFYDALRPGRSSVAELQTIAAELEAGGGVRCAALVHEAIAHYTRRGLIS
ncbi:MAG: diol dehydratase small subunit [Thermoleophilia bacterium]